MKEEIYKIFVEYFGDCLFTKLKNINNFTMYIARIASNLGIEYRYIIVFVEKDSEFIGVRKNLSMLKWINLQTRSLEEEYKIPLYSYIPVRFDQINDKIFLLNREENTYTYRCEKLPLSVILLGKKKDSIEYNQEGRLINAIETYNTIISFT